MKIRADISGAPRAQASSAGVLALRGSRHVDAYPNSGSAGHRDRGIEPESACDIQPLRSTGSQYRKEIRMTKNQATLNDVIRNSKHGFQQMDDRPGKPAKHRYERRKIRELLRSKDLAEADS